MEKKIKKAENAQDVFGKMKSASDTEGCDLSGDSTKAQEVFKLKKPSNLHAFIKESVDKLIRVETLKEEKTQIENDLKKLL